MLVRIIKHIEATFCMIIKTKGLVNGFTRMVTASLTTPAIVTVTALVTETSTYSVKTCNKRNRLTYS